MAMEGRTYDALATRGHILPHPVPTAELVMAAQEFVVATTGRGGDHLLDSRGGRLGR